MGKHKHVAGHSGKHRSKRSIKNSQAILKMTSQSLVVCLSYFQRCNASKQQQAMLLNSIGVKVCLSAGNTKKQALHEQGLLSLCIATIIELLAFAHDHLHCQTCFLFSDCSEKIKLQYPYLSAAISEEQYQYLSEAHMIGVSLGLTPPQVL